MERFLFMMPGEGKPSGGVEVLVRMASTLAQTGRDVALVYDDPSGRIPDYGHPKVVSYYDPRIRRIRRSRSGLRGWLKDARSRRSSRTRTAAGSSPLVLRRQDVVVFGEWQMADAIQAYPDNRRIVISQNPFVQVRRHRECEQRGLDPLADIDAYLGVSRSNQRLFEILGITNAANCVVGPNLGKFPFVAEKEPLISYMPRKRPDEAALLHEILTRRNAIDGFKLLAIDGMSQDEVSEIMARSLFHISLLKEESLGFPAIEAMAAGAITIGYTGFGGGEFFDETTGFPVQEGDFPGLVTTVERVVGIYRSDPKELDRLREAASSLVHSRYSAKRFEETFLDAWASVEAHVATRTG